MKKILLVTALILVMAIPAMSVGKTMPLDVTVYYDGYSYSVGCSVGWDWTGSDYVCGEYVCVFSIISCVAYAWVARPIYTYVDAIYPVEITSANVGNTYHVKGTLYSELPKNIKYQLIVKNGTTTVYKGDKIPVTPLAGSLPVQFDDFTFESSGLYTFKLKLIKSDGTIVSVTKKVFVPAAGVTFEEEPAFEEETVLEESIEE